jgi:hypothetical protein
VDPSDKARTSLFASRMDGEGGKSPPAPSRTVNNGVVRVAPQPHRCNPHVDEMIDGFFVWPPNLKKPWRDFVECMRRDPSIVIDSAFEPKDTKPDQESP